MSHERGVIPIPHGREVSLPFQELIEKELPAIVKKTIEKPTRPLNPYDSALTAEGVQQTARSKYKIRED